VGLAMNQLGVSNVWCFNKDGKSWFGDLKNGKLKGEMMGLFYFLRIQYKLLKRRYSTSVASFCKRCGRDIHDFVVDDKVWKKVEKHIKYGYTLCYDCFCELCLKEDLPSVWKLERLGKKIWEIKEKGLVKIVRL
jgi:hypothetical protein